MFVEKFLIQIKSIFKQKERKKPKKIGIIFSWVSKYNIALKLKNFGFKLVFYVVLIVLLFSINLSNQALAGDSYRLVELGLTRLEIAKSDLEIQTGLMYRKNLCSRCGMIFVFEQEDYLSFWMKNTFLPLDIVFINKFGKITTIYTNTTPLNQDLRYRARTPSQYVLEFRAGFTSQYQLHMGDYLNLENLLVNTIEFDHSYRLNQEWF